MISFRQWVNDILQKACGTLAASHVSRDNAIIDAMDRNVLPRIERLETRVHALETKEDEA